MSKTIKKQNYDHNVRVLEENLINHVSYNNGYQRNIVLPDRTIVQFYPSTGVWLHNDNKYQGTAEDMLNQFNLI